mmetsp:Transcript_33869/g.87864  ORF Transcript_33869/g.87864 Transcript_33869/m.87864 type:complete len:252 (+) Transcript_33869:237-992(+)
MAPTEEARLSTLFGSELGGRLAKLCLDVDTPTEQAPGGTTPASPIKQQDQANSRPAPDGGDGILHGQIKKASNPRGSGPGGVFQRASSLPSNAPAAGGGQGIFDKIRRASSSRFDDPLVAERPPSRQPHDSGRKHPASGGAAHSHGSRPGSAASAASAGMSPRQSIPVRWRGKANMASISFALCSRSCCSRGIQHAVVSPGGDGGESTGCGTETAAPSTGSKWRQQRQATHSLRSASLPWQQCQRAVYCQH